MWVHVIPHVPGTERGGVRFFWQLAKGAADAILDEGATMKPKD
jgi:hypothetical protein